MNTRGREREGGERGGVREGVRGVERERGRERGSERGGDRLACETRAEREKSGKEERGKRAACLPDLRFPVDRVVSISQ